MMENNYYTPDITEFKPGFEYEWDTSFLDSMIRIPKRQGWIKYVVGEEDSFTLKYIEQLLELGEIRAKCI